MYKKSFKKIDLIKYLSNKSGFSINYSKKLVNDLIQIILLNIKNEDFHLKGIGSFKILHKNARYGRNPKTKQKFLITARKTISFTASKKITDKISNIYE